MDDELNPSKFVMSVHHMRCGILD